MPALPLPDIDRRLRGDVQAPGRARHLLDDLAEPLDRDVMERFQLAVSELVTNAVVHGPAGPGERVRVRIRVGAEVIRVEVTDAGTGLDPAAGAGEGAMRESGRGLRLVEQVADRWGDGNGEGTRVWFEIDLTG